MRYILEFEMPKDRESFIDAVNGTSLRLLLQSHVSELERIANEGKRSESRIAQNLLASLRGALDEQLRLPD
jgi:hypothetical protein